MITLIKVIDCEESMMNDALLRMIPIESNLLWLA